MPDNNDIQTLQPVFDKFQRGDRSGLIPLLLDIQSIHGHLPEPMIEAVGQHLLVPLAEIYGVIEFYSMLYKDPTAKKVVRICTSPMCVQAGSDEILVEICSGLDAVSGIPTPDGEVMIEKVACLGLCDHSPAILIDRIPTTYTKGGGVQEWLKNPEEIDPVHVGGEPRWLSSRCGQIEPLDLDQYLAENGFDGLKRALNEMDPANVITEVKSSGLAGRGGAAFPTGLKWELTAAADDDVRYVVCNGDESEPGTFKDRLLLEGDPFAVIEGMILAGYAIGSHKGYLYVRGEYSRAREILDRAITFAYEAGFLGENLLGSPYSFDIELRSGAGAYICGEETALFESIEGKRGFPRLKPPFPTTHGLFRRPTVINNVETLCAAVWILAHGASEYRSVGTPESPGTKLFCVTGDVTQAGVYEVPFGISMGELIEFAGGVQGELYAVLVGGAAGSFASPDQLSLPMSIEGLRAEGLSLGSGVVNVINKERDMSAILHSLARFFAHESCGKCLPCQLGTQRQREIIERWASGNARANDRGALDDVAFAMTEGSICGLGMTASTAIVSAFEKWPELWKEIR